MLAALCNKSIFRGGLIITLVLIGSLFLALSPAVAGGGGIIDESNPCAFDGYFITVYGADPSGFWASNGDTFTGAVGSSSTRPFNPPQVGSHKVFTKFVITADLGGGLYNYDVYHIVTGCGSELPTNPAIFLSDVCEPNNGFSDDGWMTLNTNKPGKLYYAASSDGPWLTLAINGPAWVLSEANLNAMAQAAGASSYADLWLKSGEAGTARLLGPMIADRAARMDAICEG